MDVTWPLSDGRIALRPAEPSDASALLDYRQLPECRAWVSRTLDTLDEARAFIDDVRARPEALLCVVELEGRVVGDVGGRRFRPDSLGAEPDAWDFHLGYTVHPRTWGRGVASAAVGLLLPTLHEQLGVRRVVARCFADNVASLRVLEKNDFRLEGTERAAVLGRDGRWLDDCLLAHVDGRSAQDL